jgi:co-chaperonin GroES (HSP10)
MEDMFYIKIKEENKMNIKPPLNWIFIEDVDYRFAKIIAANKDSSISFNYDIGDVIIYDYDKVQWMIIDEKTVGLLPFHGIKMVAYIHLNKKEEQSELSMFTPKILNTNILVDNIESVIRYNSDQVYSYGKVIATGDLVDWDIKIGDKVLFHENYVIRLFVNQTFIGMIDSDNISKQNED